MSGQQRPEQLFEQHRPRLRALAVRLVGSAEADDAVQATWLRFATADAAEIDNIGAWLTTVLGRLSIDLLRARDRRTALAEAPAPTDRAPDPLDEVVLADAVGAALGVVLDRLTPAERVAFVLHDTFAVPFEDIAAVLVRSPAAAKQLAMRARAKVRNEADELDEARRADTKVVDAFLAASRAGDLAALVATLHPDITLTADRVAVTMGSPGTLAGPEQVAGMFSGRALGAQPASIDGGLGLVWIVGGAPKVAWEFTIVDGLVTGIEMLADPDTLALATIAPPT